MWIKPAPDPFVERARAMLWEARADVMHALTCEDCDLRMQADLILAMVHSSPTEFINLWTEDEYGI